MSERLTRIALFAAIALLAAFVAEPYLARYFLTDSAPRPIAARGDLAPAETVTVELFQRVSPSVVHVYAQPDPRALAAPDRDDPFGAPDGQEGAPGGGGSGTGFIWDRAGHVVTNNHVVQGAGRVAIRLSSGEVVPASVVGLAPNSDLAVLRLGRVREPPPPIVVGSSGELKVGQAVFAIGNPFGLDQTLTTGIVSALNRQLPTQEGRELSGVIQTDAAINPGNSGGPLLDSAGRLIGVNTAIYSPSGASAGIGFAIPVDVVNRVVPQLIATGRVPTPGIGIVPGNEATAARLGIEGVVVLRTLPGGAAARAGLRPVDPRTGELGDVIVAVNGRPVRRINDLTAALANANVGDKAEVVVDRGGRQATVAVEVEDVGRPRER